MRKGHQCCSHLDESERAEPPGAPRPLPPSQEGTGNKIPGLRTTQGSRQGGARLAGRVGRREEKRKGDQREKGHPGLFLSLPLWEKSGLQYPLKLMIDY